MEDKLKSDAANGVEKMSDVGDAVPQSKPSQ